MRKFLFFVPATAGIALAGGAEAADPPIIETYNPEVVVYEEIDSNWAGMYLGLHAGFGWGDFNATVVGGIDPPYEAEGFVAGGQIGYDIQTNNWVWGVVLDGSYTGVDGTTAGLAPLPQYTSELTWLATLRGRVGYAMGSFLPYVTAGGAIGSIDSTLGALSDDQIHTGWTAGAGVEVALGNGLTLGGEYLFVDLDTERYTFGPDQIDTDLELHVWRATLNYRMNY